MSKMSERMSKSCLRAGLMSDLGQDAGSPTTRPRATKVSRHSRPRGHLLWIAVFGACFLATQGMQWQKGDTSARGFRKHANNVREALQTLYEEQQKVEGKQGEGSTTGKARRISGLAEAQSRSLKSELPKLANSLFMTLSHKKKNHIIVGGRSYDKEFQFVKDFLIMDESKPIEGMTDDEITSLKLQAMGVAYRIFTCGLMHIEGLFPTGLSPNLVNLTKDGTITDSSLQQGIKNEFNVLYGDGVGQAEDGSHAWKQRKDYVRSCLEVIAGLVTTKPVRPIFGAKTSNGLDMNAAVKFDSASEPAAGAA